MTQFVGEYEVPVDDKGRVFIPVELRRKLVPEAGDTFIIVRGLDGCLTAHPQNTWARIAQRMMELPQTEKRVRLFYRGILSQAAEARLDRQGRVSINRKLLERVGIGERMIIIGALDRLELWDPETWTQYIAEADSNLEEVAETLTLNSPSDDGPQP